MAHDLWIKNFSVRIDDYDQQGNMVQNIAETDIMDSDSKNDQSLRNALLVLAEKHKMELYQLFLHEVRNRE